MSAIENNRRQSGWLHGCVERFRCIGPECEESCCGGWQITMDEPALVALSGLNDARVQTVLTTHLRRFDTSSKPTQMGWLGLKHDGSCPFLEPEGLCGIQARHGEDPMPLGCKVYPRVHHRIDGEVHSSLSLSCPEAARLVLCSTDESARPAPQTVLEETLASLPEAATVTEMFWSWQGFHEAILRSRQWPMADRLLLLGSLARSLDARRDGNAAAALREICRVLLDQGKMPGAASGTIAPEPLEFLLSAMNTALGFAGGNRRFRELTARVLRGMAYQNRHQAGHQAVVELLPRCQQLRDEVLEPVLTNHPQWMENYLCNELIRGLYPLGTATFDACGTAEHEQNEDAFAGLSLQWAWIRLYWIGVAGDAVFDLEAAALCVQSLSRAVFARSAEFAVLRHAWKRLMRMVPLEKLLSL